MVDAEEIAYTGKTILLYRLGRTGASNTRITQCFPSKLIPALRVECRPERAGDSVYAGFADSGRRSEARLTVKFKSRCQSSNRSVFRSIFRSLLDDFQFGDVFIQRNLFLAAAAVPTLGKSNLRRT